MVLRNSNSLIGPSEYEISFNITTQTTGIPISGWVKLVMITSVSFINAFVYTEIVNPGSINYIVDSIPAGLILSRQGSYPNAFFEIFISYFPSFDRS